MGRMKEPAKPLFSLKFDFVASLDNVCHQAIMLMQAVDMVLRNSDIPEPIKEILAERAKAMRAALSSED